MNIIRIGIRIGITSVAALAMLVGSAPSVHADDPPPYQIGQNPSLPGLQPYQPHCAVAPISCGFLYDPSNGTWYQKEN